MTPEIGYVNAIKREKRMSQTFTATLCSVTWAFALALPAADTPDQTPSCNPETGVCTLPTQTAPQPGGKTIWAHSKIFTDAPPFEAGKWLTQKPDTEGKFIIIEFWRTWCGACKRMTPRMNALQKKFGDELVVIGITGESEKAVNAYAGPKKEYYLALDKPQSAKPPTPEEQSAVRRMETEPVAALRDQAGSNLTGPTRRS